MRSQLLRSSVVVIVAGLLGLDAAGAEVDNLRIVTDASPDYSDMDGLIHSITGKWATPEEKCWALFYWNHIGRRQTPPMILHGVALSDPIRQFNDYGFTMCSTISGMNCSIWDALGLKAKYWDISHHTVAEVEYGGRWHMYDGSLSAIYTLCDGKTVAGVEDIGKTLACDASGGKAEPGHVARYHCLNATSKDGFLTGSDTMRSLDDEVHCFRPGGLLYRSYYYDWDRGHRYILNLREGETYTRHYASLGDTPEFYVPNQGKPPSGRFAQRGNGTRTFRPSLTADSLPGVAHTFARLKAVAPAGLEPLEAGTPGEVTFKVEGANVITRLAIDAEFIRQDASDVNAIAISTTNGLTWGEPWKNEETGRSRANLKFVNEVNGAYEVLVKVTLQGRARLGSIAFETTTQLNAKTQPKLNLGRNTIHVGAGDQTGSIVFWPELQDGKALPYIVEQHNVRFAKKNPGYMGTLHAEKADEDAWVVFRIDAPRDVTCIHYGGRFYNRAPGSHIDLLHSFDGGKAWTTSRSLTETKQPWDVIAYETVDRVPPGTRSVLFKYLLNGPAAGTAACSIYALRMEANHRSASPTFRPIEVTFTWAEPQEDRSLVVRSHTEMVPRLPWTYRINVGGEDHPVMKSLRVNLKDPATDLQYGYSDGKDCGGERIVPRWIGTGRNLAEGKRYTLSVPSESIWEAGDPAGRKLTDGIAGPCFSGGSSYKSGAIWGANKNPVITLDLGASMSCASFGMNFHGYPGLDALKGEITDEVEVLVSSDGTNYTSSGFLQTDLRRKDIPINFMLPDDETLRGATFRLIPETPVEARYVQFKVTNKRYFDVTELEVLDASSFKAFDLRIALPDEPMAVAPSGPSAPAAER
jgi:hypothetical protein